MKSQVAWHGPCQFLESLGVSLNLEVRVLVYIGDRAGGQVRCMVWMLYGSIELER